MGDPASALRRAGGGEEGGQDWNRPAEGSTRGGGKMQHMSETHRSVPEIAAQLSALGLDAGAFVMVHASLRKVGPVTGRADGLLDAIRSAIGESGTMLMVLGAEDDHAWVNERPAAERGFTPAEMTRTQLGDLAMATIAVLYEVPLTELGFSEAAADPKRGFMPNDIGYPVDDDSARTKARATSPPSPHAPRSSSRPTIPISGSSA